MRIRPPTTEGQTEDDYLLNDPHERHCGKHKVEGQRRDRHKLAQLDEKGVGRRCQGDAKPHAHEVQGEDSKNDVEIPSAGG